MPTEGTPAAKYPYKTDAKNLKKSYELRLQAQFGDAASKRRLATYNRRRKERMLEAGNKEWLVDGKNMTRYQCMDYIVTQVASGSSLPGILSVAGMPTMQQVYGWFKHHPDFEREMARAEEVRGHILGEEALQIARDTDRENVAADKLKIEVLSKFAARSNNRFQDKQVVQAVDEMASMTDEQIRTRIRALLNANPDLGVLKTDEKPSLILDAEEIHQPELPCAAEDPDQS